MNYINYVDIKASIAQLISAFTVLSFINNESFVVCTLPFSLFRSFISFSFSDDVNVILDWLSAGHFKECFGLLHECLKQSKQIFQQIFFQSYNKYKAFWWSFGTFLIQHLNFSSSSHSSLKWLLGFALDILLCLKNKVKIFKWNYLLCNRHHPEITL